MIRQTPWGLVLLLWAAGLLSAAQFARVALSLEALALLYPGWPVAFLVSGVAAVGVVFGVMAGGIVARLGAARVLRWALVISAASVLAQVTFPSFPFLMALRVIEGAGHLALVVALPTLMATLASDRDRSLVMGLWAAFFGVGFSLTVLVVKVLPDPSALFAAHGLAFALMAVVLWRLPESDAPENRPLQWNPVPLYRVPRLMAPGLGHGLYASMFIGLMTFLPGALGQDWLAPILPLVGVTGALFAGVLARTIAPGTLVVGGFSGVALLFLSVHILTGPAAAILAIVAILISGLVAGGGFAAVPWLSTAMADRAFSNGILAQLGNLGTFVSVPLYQAMGPDRIALGAAVMAGASCLLTLLAYRAARP